MIHKTKYTPDSKERQQITKYEMLRIVDAVIFLGSLGIYTSTFGSDYLFITLEPDEEDPAPPTRARDFTIPLIVGIFCLVLLVEVMFQYV